MDAPEPSRLSQFPSEGLRFPEKPKKSMVVLRMDLPFNTSGKMTEIIVLELSF
jgi:hypothetical protein